MGRKKKYRGHFCWACGRIRPNERFGGSGHKRHVCRECQKLGAEELSYRQGIRDVDRCLNFGGGVRRKNRRVFEGFLTHTNPRIREYAQKIKTDLDLQGVEFREAMALDEAMTIEFWEHEIPEFGSSQYGGFECEIEETIPF